jgi:hypothetical protein
MATPQLDRIEILLRDHIQASSAGRVAMQAQIDSATEVTNEIKSTVHGLSVLGKVAGWIGVIAMAIAAIVGLWQLMGGGRNGG